MWNVRYNWGKNVFMQWCTFHFHLFSPSKESNGRKHSLDHEFLQYTVLYLAVLKWVLLPLVVSHCHYIGPTKCYQTCRYHQTVTLTVPDLLVPSHQPVLSCYRYSQTSLYGQTPAAGTVRPVSTVRPQLQVLSDVGTVRPAEPVTIGTVRSIATQTSLGHAIWFYVNELSSPWAL